MGNTESLQQGKINKILDTKINYSAYGVMTRRCFLETVFKNGGVSELSDKPRVMFDRIKFNRMRSYEEQRIYEAKCDERVPLYKIKISADTSSYYEVTKTEYDYFNNLKITE